MPRVLYAFIFSVLAFLLLSGCLGNKRPGIEPTTIVRCMWHTTMDMPEPVSGFMRISLERESGVRSCGATQTHWLTCERALPSGSVADVEVQFNDRGVTTNLCTTDGTLVGKLECREYNDKGSEAIRHTIKRALVGCVAKIRVP